MNMFRVQQIDHVELFVPDRYEAAKWYEQVLGLKIARDYEFWAKDSGGPLMIMTADGSTKLALFTGEPRGQRPTAGFHRVAFRVDGPGFLEFCRRLETVTVNRNDGQRLTAQDVVDHDKSWSIYFVDPWGHRLEVTTYDYGAVKAKR
jgi:catechol 2,3-dioxygenase-like lactoylglutathione lyase family enzyme